MCCVSSVNCLAVLELNFSRYTVIACMVVSYGPYIDNACIKEFDVAWRKAFETRFENSS